MLCYQNNQWRHGRKGKKKYAHPKLLAAKKLSKNFFLLQYFNANIHNLGLKIPILEKFKKKLS